MKASIEKLHKFFTLEAERGYDNGAVLGGLERMIEPWTNEARAEGLPEDLIQTVVTRLRDYRRLSPDSRREVLRGIWERVRRSLDVSHLETPPPARETVRPKARTRPRAVQEPPKTEERPARSAPARPRAAVAADLVPDLDQSVTTLPGIGPRNAKTLARLGLHTLGDVLYYFPRRYDDYSQLKPINRLRYGDQVTVLGKVQSVHSRQVRGREMTIVEAVLHDGSGALRLTWFNQPWQTKRLRTGMIIAAAGVIDQYLGRLVMNNPEWEPVNEQQLQTARIVPVYPLTEGITQRWLRRKVHAVVSEWAPHVPDPLPEGLRQAAELMPLPEALQQVHFPDSQETLHAARERLAFDEIFLLQLGVLRQKRQWEARSARTFPVSDEWLQARLDRLPYPLTGAQRRALEDIRRDLNSGRPMNRLLQGDVGAGKTVVAALAMAMVLHGGAQTAMMAPTAILAEQHYRNLLGFLGDLLPLERIRLLVSATPESEKCAIREGLAAGEIQVVVGTHALLEDPVTFHDLQLAVIDEQHRFGVRQRAALRQKGENPHLLVMTATPIPRSLALTIYGDLDLTVLDEMPPGRQPVGTYLLYPREREHAYRLIEREVRAGRQAFIVYPLVEGDGEKAMQSAVAEFERLQREVFPDFTLGLLHGRMKPDEKDEVMRRFRDGEVQVLVSTTVVEVGVDVPNATVMLIEGANRFGLAQLHQLRGRVGRGAEQSYCILIPETENAVEENERLQAMVETNDGFVLAERDLEQRGPGEFLGTRQAGFTDLRLASLTDTRLIEKARHHAQALFEQDPDLTQPEHKLLAQMLARFWQPGQGDVS